MKYLNEHAQIDIIDYMIAKFNDVPLLDHSMTDKTASDDVLYAQGVPNQSSETMDQFELIEQGAERAEQFQVRH